MRQFGYSLAGSHDSERAATFWRGGTAPASEWKLVTMAMDNQQERDQQMRETLRKQLDGHWEYVCRVTSSEPFEDNKWGRGGVMTITMSLPWTGVMARIMAERLWAITSPEDTPADRVPLPHAIQWHAVGAVIFYEGGLSFEYFSGDGHGLTKDAFKLFEEDGRVHMHPGTFEHQRADGHSVAGTVRLRKMQNYGDFEWAPNGINPAGTST